MYVKRVLLHTPPKWVRFPRSGLIIMSIRMPCTCISTTQVKTRVGWVSTFEHTSLVLVLGCRLIFGRPYIPEIGIGKKLIFSGVLPLPGYYCYKVGITSGDTSLPWAVHRPEYVHMQAYIQNQHS
jgi:hypothetical protein